MIPSQSKTSQSLNMYLYKRFEFFHDTQFIVSRSLLYIHFHKSLLFKRSMLRSVYTTRLASWYIVVSLILCAIIYFQFQHNYVPEINHFLWTIPSLDHSTSHNVPLIHIFVNHQSHSKRIKKNTKAIKACFSFTLMNYSFVCSDQGLGPLNDL